MSHIYVIFCVNKDTVFENLKGDFFMFIPTGDPRLDLLSFVGFCILAPLLVSPCVAEYAWGLTRYQGAMCMNCFSLICILFIGFMDKALILIYLPTILLVWVFCVLLSLLLTKLTENTPPIS